MPGESARRNGRKGGRPKGSRSQATMDKLQAREFVRKRVTEALGSLLEAQVANASGIKYLVARDPKTGKFERIAASQVRDDAVIEVWEKDPSVQAFTDLLNRALDKPAEQKQEHEHSGTLTFKHELPE